MAIIAEDYAFRLFGKIQNYSWGGYYFIPQLIGQKPEPGITYAEYWMGDHDKAPSDILQNDGTFIPLNKLIEKLPERVLGPSVARKYGRLPFLFKILDVREMLSIQVHPTKAQAEIGFARENEMGIPLDAPERNYKDNNHKPELQLALGDFWLLHGFRPADQLHKILTQVPEFNTLLPLFINDGYPGLYKYIMEMPPQLVNAVLDPLAERILTKYDRGELEKCSPDFWAARAMRNMQGPDYDRGIFSIYFFNLLKLKQGQAIFQDAGIPHAALMGQAIEIMANSDNVIRGGLTPKYIDVPQLLKLISFKGVIPEIVEGKPGTNPYEVFYQSPSPDFYLSKIQLNEGEIYETTTYSTEIGLNLNGKAILDTTSKEMPLSKGESAIVFSGKKYRLRGVSENVLLFKASVPNSHVN
jgi:mannose-6-phosphate isomerase